MRVAIRQSWQRLKGGAGLLRGGVADLVFPPSCVSCDAEFNEESSLKGDSPICERCIEQMEIFSGPTCMRCGGPVPFVGLEGEELARARTSGGCYRCRGRKIWFDETIALGLYSDRLRQLVLRMKQATGDSLSLAMGRLIWQIRGERLAAIGADVLAPIPLHWRRRVMHRTNSAAVLAEVLSARLGVPMAERLVRRSRYTLRQFDLNPPKRWENVRKAFVVRAGYHLKDAHVLLVDDILTTGATCSEAARALRSAGAARVTVVVVARALG